jgi:monovalent cation:H+ antiporter, CPA1 family
MDLALGHTIGLLGVAILVALLARRLSLPYTVGLVVTGVGLAVARLETGAMLTHDFILDVILPPLLFEAAINIRWRPLSRDFLPIIVLSTLGVIISAAVVAGGMTYFLNWPLASAIVFGVLIAATDPIAVIALFKDAGIGGRLRLLVESESLFNDGVAAVFFGVALAWAQLAPDASISGLHVATTLAEVAGGGVLVGIISGFVCIGLAWRTSDHLVETTVTVVAAYGSFLIAEYFHFSGVLSTVAAGILIGNLGVLVEDEARMALSQQGREFVIAFWDLGAFIANSLVFLGRALTVYPLCLLFMRSRWAIPLLEQHILWWGGLRGALALALALALPSSLPFDNAILFAAFGVVAFSVVAQGLTISPLIGWLGLTKGGPMKAAPLDHLDHA